MIMSKDIYPGSTNGGSTHGDSPSSGPCEVGTEFEGGPGDGYRVVIVEIGSRLGG